MQRTFLCCPHPGAMKSGPIKLCKPWAVAGAAAGRASSGIRRLETEIQPWRWPVPRQLCRAAPAHSTVPTCLLTTVAFVVQDCRLSGPHSKWVESDSTAGSRHIIQRPHSPKYSDGFRSLSFPALEGPSVDSLLPKALTSRASRAHLVAFILCWKINQPLPLFLLFPCKGVSGTRNEKATGVTERLNYTKWLRDRNLPD